MKTLFFYHLHGLIIQSDIELPELLPHTGAVPDIQILLGSLDHIPVPIHRMWGNHFLAPDRVLLNIKGVARFHVTGGKEILVDPAPCANKKEIRLFILGSSMGCLLHQRLLLPMHANALLYGNECIMFMGPSGAGKSTLAAAMKNRGYKVLADDLCALQYSPAGAAIVYPGVPQIKLWKDAAHHLDEDVTLMKRVLPDEDKYALPIDNAYCRHPLPIRCIYLLDFHDGRNLEISDLGLLEKIAVIKQNTYRKGMIAGLGIAAHHLKLSGELAASTPIRQMLRPRDSLKQINKLIDVIEEDLA